MIDLTIDPLDWHALSDAQRDDLYAICKRLQSERSQPKPTDAQLEQFFAMLPTLLEEICYWLLYVEQTTCVGYCVLQYPKQEHPDYAARRDNIHVETAILPTYRKRAIAEQLLAPVVAYAQVRDATWVQWDVDFDEGVRFSQELGALEAGREQVNRLAVEQIDWPMLESWCEEGVRQNHNLSLLWFVNRPKMALLQPFCDLVTAINRLQPTDDVEGMAFTQTVERLLHSAEMLSIQNKKRLVLCAQHGDGTLIGMTDLYLDAEHPSKANVQLSGVRGAYQNRGVGKWLKAAMLFALREQHPEVTHLFTENFTSNAPMLHLNERLGFVCYEQHVFFKLHIDALAARAVCYS